MEPNEMSNEELIFKYFYSGCDNAGEHATMAVEIQNRLRSIDGMIPRPKVEVVNFENWQWRTVINGRIIEIDNSEYQAKNTVYAITTALGMDVAKEGGVYVV